jgi:ATP-dependent Clp protease ATP-binding subunit ClpA
MKASIPDMGARPLRRIIQQKVEDRLSDALLGKEFEEGDRILVDIDDENEITLHATNLRRLNQKKNWASTPDIAIKTTDHER